MSSEDTPKPDEVQATSSEEATPKAPVTPEAPEAVTDEIVDVEWEQLEHLFKARELFSEMEQQFAMLCSQYEKQKFAMIQALSRQENGILQGGAQLKNSLGIAPELTYELKLPAREGEKGFFIRKDS